MSALKEQLRLLGQFLQSDFRRTLWGCALILTAAVALGAVLGLLSPEAVDMVLAQFMAMVEESGIIDSAGNLSPFGLLTNNWTAMLVAVLYGFIPFLYLPALTLASNGLLVGLMAAWYHSGGISMGYYLAGILPHGVFELPALVLASACGVYLCRNMGRLVVGGPGRVPMVELLCGLLRVLLLTVMPLTVAAAFIDAYVTPAVMALFLPG